MGLTFSVVSDVPPPPLPPPAGPPAPPGMVFQPGVPMSSASVRPSYSGKAVAAVVLGVIGIVLCFTAIPAIVALIIGLVARSEIRHSGGRLIGHRMARTGIVLGIVGILVGVAFYVAAALGVFDSETRIAGAAEARAAVVEVVRPDPCC